jgi:hypothetical protein
MQATMRTPSPNQSETVSRSPVVEVAHRTALAEAAPQPERVLDAVDRKRRHRDRDCDQQAARDAQVALVPEMMPGDGEGNRIGDSGGGQRPATHRREGERREQPHGAHDDQRAGIPEQMCEVEQRRGGSRRRAGVTAAEKIKQRAQSIGLERARIDRGAQVLIGEMHGMLRRQTEEMQLSSRTWPNMPGASRGPSLLDVSRREQRRGSRGAGPRGGGQVQNMAFKTTYSYDRLLQGGTG